MYHFCTYFDSRYLPRGIALSRSLIAHCRPCTLWVLCLDAHCSFVLEQLRLPHLQIIRLDDLEAHEPDLRAVKKTRSLVEYYFTLTPVLPLHLLETHADIERITYLDSDMYFFSDLAPMIEEWSSGSVAIVEHRFPTRLRHHQRWGKFNVGIVSFARDGDGLACLTWWRDRCLEWCYDRIQGDRFADQGYLNDFPLRFSGVIVMRHLGVNVAPWNLENHPLTVAGDSLRVRGEPLICFHFQGLRPIRKWLFETNLDAYGVRLTPPYLRRLYAPYIAELYRSTILIDALSPSRGRTGLQSFRPLTRVTPAESTGTMRHSPRGVSYGKRISTLIRNVITRRCLIVIRGRTL